MEVFMNTRRIAVRGIVYRNGEILVAKFRQKDGSESEYWGTFGGGLDADESLEAGLTREMIEETGVQPVIGKLLFIQQFINKGQDNLEFFFEIKNVEDYAAFDLEATSHGILELNRSDFVDPKKELMKPTFLSTIDIEGYIKEDRPVYIWNEYK
jgi:8-oxo-dGTP pyrophosphatase MutT (NUDIX family)